MHRPAPSESEGHGMRPSPSFPYLVSLLPAQVSGLGNFHPWILNADTAPGTLAYSSPRTTCVNSSLPTSVSPSLSSDSRRRPAFAPQTAALQSLREHAPRRVRTGIPRS